MTKLRTNTTSPKFVPGLAPVGVKAAIRAIHGSKTATHGSRTATHGSGTATATSEPGTNFGGRGTRSNDCVPASPLPRSRPNADSCPSYDNLRLLLFVILANSLGLRLSIGFIFPRIIRWLPTNGLPIDFSPPCRTGILFTMHAHVFSSRETMLYLVHPRSSPGSFRAGCGKNEWTRTANISFGTSTLATIS